MPVEDLTLTTESDGDARIIHVVGELDLSTVSMFEAELAESFAAGLIVVELSGCAFIDSSALRAIVRAHGEQREGGGELAIVAPSQPARRVIEVASLDRLLPVFETVADALTSVA